MTLKVNCPTCGREVEYSPNNPYRPFCCERCKIIDMGAWANDEYVIPGKPVEGDDEIDFDEANLSGGRLPELRPVKPNGKEE